MNSLSLLWFIGAAWSASLPEHSSDFDRYFSSAVVHYERLNYEIAILHANRAEARAENVAEEARAALLLGILYADARKGSEAAAAFERAFTIKPDAQLPLVASPKIARLSEKMRHRAKQSIAKTEEIASALVVKARSPKKCSNSPLLPVNIWSKQRATSLRERLNNSSAEVASGADELTTRLDDWARVWGDQQFALCLRGEVYLQLSEQEVRGRRQCLESQSQAIEALIEAMLAERVIGPSALSAIRNLPIPSDCNSRGGRYLPIERTPLENEAGDLVNRASAFLEIAEREKTEPLIARLLEVKSQIRDPVLNAEVSFWLGIYKQQLGKPQEAVKALQESVTRFIEANRPQSAVRALTQLVATQGNELNDLPGARLQYNLAQKILSHESDAKLQQARLLARMAVALGVNGKLIEAVALLKRAQRTIETSEICPTRDLETVAILINLGTAQGQLSERKAAIQTTLRAEEIAQTKLGSNSPTLVTIWINLGLAHLNLGNFTDARKYFEKALQLSSALKWPAGKGPEAELGELDLVEGRANEAVPLLQAANDWNEKAYSPQHPTHFNTWMPLGIAYRVAGQVDRAFGYHERSLLLAKNQTDAERQAMAEVELAADYLAAEQWDKIPPLTKSCERAISKRLLNSYEHAQCLMVQARFAQHESRPKDAQRLFQQLIALRSRATDPSWEPVVERLRTQARTSVQELTSQPSP